MWYKMIIHISSLHEHTFAAAQIPSELYIFCSTARSKASRGRRAVYSSFSCSGERIRYLLSQLYPILIQESSNPPTTPTKADTATSANSVGRWEVNYCRIGQEASAGRPHTDSERQDDRTAFPVRYSAGTTDGTDVSLLQPYRELSSRESTRNVVVVTVERVEVRRVDVSEVMRAEMTLTP